MVAALALAAGSAMASENLGFETGDLTGWLSNGVGSAGALDSIGPFAPSDGAYLGYVEGGEQDLFATLSQTFSLQAGQRLSGYVGFRANDVYEDGGIIFNDEGYLAINGMVLFSRDVLAVGDFGSSGWVNFGFVAPVAGDYVLEIGAANHGDSGFASSVVLDGVTVASVPEPGAWTLLILGFGFSGHTLRQRRVTALSSRMR